MQDLNVEAEENMLEATEVTERRTLRLSFRDHLDDQTPRLVSIVSHRRDHERKQNPLGETRRPPCS